MKPLIVQVLKDSSKETLVVDSVEFKEMLNKAYESGVEDGKNIAFAQVYKEQWLPYKQITYPTYSPHVTPYYYTTGDGDINWSDMNVTCDESKTTGGAK